MGNSPHQLDHRVINSRGAALPSLVEKLTSELYEGLLILDGSRKVSFVNQAAELLLGQSSEQLTGRGLEEIFPTDQVNLVFDSRGQTHRFTTEIQPNENHCLPALVTVTTLPFSIEGLGIVSVVALPQADQWTEKLIHCERLAGLGTMSASISHEMINPISVIGTTTTNLLEILAEDHQPEQPLGDEILRSLQMIDTNVGRCYRLIDTLRAYTYGERMREKTAINDLIEHAVTLMGAQIEKHDNLRLKTELNPELPEISCDPGQITQVLINLMLNARDAMASTGGEIELKTWAIPELDSVAISVQDNGTGLPGEALPQLFEPFFTTKKRGEGTGLGLFIVSEIVKQHNGWIRAQNRVGADQSISGAQITLMLPI